MPAITVPTAFRGECAPALRNFDTLSLREALRSFTSFPHDALSIVTCPMKNWNWTVRSSAPWFALITMAVLAIYLPGLSNELLFDDQILTDGYILEHYSGVPDLLQRFVSYGSFIWLGGLSGEGWHVHRIVNILLHLGVVAGLLALYELLSSRVRWPDEFVGRVDFDASRRAAVRVATMLFAVNPVAVYAVAYLIQRSMLAATFFVVLGLFACSKGLLTTRGKAAAAVWHLGALACYLLAMLSKEHALMAPLLVLPLYIFLNRPSLKRLLILIGVTGAVVGTGVLLLLRLYAHLLGQPFDELSVAYVEELRRTGVEVESVLWLLSIANQMKLFFQYGFLWFIPNPGWMSIDLRPAFPTALTDWRAAAGVLGYLAVLSSALVVLMRSSGPAGFAGLCLLIPGILFMTEFATVWIQDPFVLYRSYLWAIGLPGLLVLLFAGGGARTIYIIGLLIAIVLAGLAFERGLSLSNARSAWSDAIEKLDDEAPYNAFGRWRPYLNRGSTFLENGELQPALQDFIWADRLNEPQGAANYNMGVAFQMLGRHDEAIAAFEAAQKKGYGEDGLNYHLAETLHAVGRFEEAFKHYTLALKPGIQLEFEVHILLRRAEAAIPSRRFDQAVSDFDKVLSARPGDIRVLTGLGMALLGQQNAERAVRIFDSILARQASAPVFYGRGMARFMLGRRAESIEDLSRAVRLDPRNPAYKATLDHMLEQAGQTQ